MYTRQKATCSLHCVVWSLPRLQFKQQTTNFYFFVHYMVSWVVSRRKDNNDSPASVCRFQFCSAFSRVSSKANQSVCRIKGYCTAEQWADEPDSPRLLCITRDRLTRSSHSVVSDMPLITFLAGIMQSIMSNREISNAVLRLMTAVRKKKRQLKIHSLLVTYGFCWS
jgi:hypothetical protein